jgi:hypothetical protein
MAAAFYPYISYKKTPAPKEARVLYFIYNKFSLKSQATLLLIIAPRYMFIKYIQ